MKTIFDAMKTPESPTTIQTTLSALMKTRGWNQQALADHLDVNKSAVSNWLSGEREPDKEHLMKILELIASPATPSKQKFSVVVIPIIGIMDAENKVGGIVAKIMEAVKGETND